MICKTVLIAALLAVSAGAAAADSAIKVSVDKGSVLVNQGKQFVSATAGQSVSPGDRVMVMAGGKATLTYPNGCRATVPAGSMVDVNAHCTTASAKKVGSMYAAAVGDNEDHDGRPGPLFWGVLAGVGIVTAIIINQNGDGISRP